LTRFKYFTDIQKHRDNDSQLLGSTQYVKSKLENLTPKQLEQIKQAFIANKHPRFKKELTGTKNQPYGETGNYIKSVNNANNEKITKLVKLVGMLLQIKIYLFWSRPSDRGKPCI